MSGSRGNYAGTAGATVLARDSSDAARAGILARSFGAGRIVLFADVDIIAGALSVGNAIQNNNDRFLANLFAFAGALPFNYQGLWWNSPQASEPGWGINFSHQGDIIFATWFTYDLEGKPWWLGVTAIKTAENVYTGSLFTTTGPPFNAVPWNPGLVVETNVGTATFTFNDYNNATFAYTIETPAVELAAAGRNKAAVAQVKSITRQLFAEPVPGCAWNVQPDLTQATNTQGLWWKSPASSESGWGINLTEQGDIIFATWFTYDLAGKPWWLAIAAEKTGPGVWEGDIFTTTASPFNASPWVPAIETTVGTGAFTVDDGNDVTWSYTVNGVSQSKQLTRQVFAGAGTTCN
jgi:hypothetical protein